MVSELIQIDVGGIAARRKRVRRDGDDARRVVENDFRGPQQPFGNTAAVFDDILDDHLIGRLPFLRLVQPFHALAFARAHRHPLGARINQAVMHRLARRASGLAPLARSDRNLILAAIIHIFPLQREQQVLGRHGRRWETASGNHAIAQRTNLAVGHYGFRGGHHFRISLSRFRCSSGDSFDSSTSLA